MIYLRLSIAIPKLHTKKTCYGVGLLLEWGILFPPQNLSWWWSEVFNTYLTTYIHLIVNRQCCSLNHSQTTGHLYALRWKRGHEKGDRKEASHHTIKLTDELRTMSDAIIECRNVDSRWMFVRVRNDFKHPNVHLGPSGTHTQLVVSSTIKVI